jgi:ATP-dependent helicase Lhr and Lhr-like helicase
VATEPATQVRVIRKQLGSLWNVFFGGFGRLTRVQMEAVPVLLAGKDAVLCSPTASGKTEAVLAPVVRHLLDAGSDRPGPQVLYIAPTRALVADLKRRLESLFKQVDLVASFRTADSPHLPKKFPNILVTTPESFDSLLCRRKRIWANLEVVILDELHLLDHTYRGDQLRVLLQRQQLDNPDQKLHRIALSATIPDPDAVARRYIGPAHIVATGEPRSIEFDLVADIAEAIQRCKQVKRHKILVFCNARKDCEELAAEVVSKRLWPRDSVFVHHASLSRSVRKDVEETLREGHIALCFATMTLELGIDIGDIDAAVLFRPPPDLNSFQQRLGRACRRERKIFALGIIKDEDEEPAFRLYEQMTNDAETITKEYRSDLSVVVQQLLSILFANPSGITLDRAYDYVRPLCDLDEFESIAWHLADQEMVEIRSRRIYATQKTMDLGEKGEVHSNIADSRSVEVFDSQSGRVIGKIAWSPDNKGDVVLGGRHWRITGSGRDRLFVAPTGQPARAGTFRRHSGVGHFFRFLPPAMQAAVLDRD